MDQLDPDSGDEVGQLPTVGEEEEIASHGDDEEKEDDDDNEEGEESKAVDANEKETDVVKEKVVEEEKEDTKAALPKKETKASNSRTSFSYKPSSSRTIRLFKNGDKFFAGKVLLVPKHGNLDSFLDLVTSILADGKPVLKLFDAQTGAELLELSQIIDGDNYVAGMSRGKFRPLPYAEILDDRARAEINKTPRPPFTLPKPSTYKAPKLKKKNAVYSPGRKSPRERSKPKGLPALPISEKPRLVSLVRNGDASVEIVKLLLTKRNTADWDHLCQEISDKLQMGVAVRKIYTQDGIQVTLAEDMLDSEVYVAAEKGFRPLENGYEVMNAHLHTHSTMASPSPGKRKRVYVRGVGDL
eukprot:gene23519-9100_t